jgi:hypothetical protein
MTTPPAEGSDPAVPVPPVPESTPEEAAAQQAAAEAAAAEAALTEQIRALAAKIAEQAVLDFDPATIRKGAVTAIATGATPPTLSVQISGDTTTTIDGIRYLDSYAPVAGDTVLIIKQGTDLVALGEIAAQFSESAWETVSLASGFTHNGNLNGNAQIRRIWDHGTWKVQMQGAVDRSSGSLVATLDVKYRPAARRSLLCTRTAIGGSNVVKIDIETNGQMILIGMTAAPGSDGSHNHSIGITDNAHTHGISSYAHTHGQHNHGVSITDNAHTHQIRETVHNHSGAVSATSPHTHGTQGALGTAVTINGTTGNRTPDSSSHAHGGDTSGTAVTINGTSGSVGNHSHTVDEPSWISFNQLEWFI